jgi:transposase
MIFCFKLLAYDALVITNEKDFNLNITHHLPKIINKSREELDAAIREIQTSNLSKETQDLMIGCIEFSTWLPGVIREKNISIHNLQRMLFGEGGRLRKKKKKDKPESSSDSKQSTESSGELPPVAKNAETQEASSSNGDAANDADTLGEPKVTENSRQGHGRLGEAAYVNAINIPVRLSNPCAGEACPSGCGGRLYLLKKHRVVIRVLGNPLSTVHRYQLERLRCGLCGEVVSAELPPSAPKTKYDAAFRAQLALQKYYVAVPFYRQEQLQRMLGFPLPDATQFELVEFVADAGYPVVRVLERVAANGELVHNDDTTAKILSVIKENKANPTKTRTGMKTSCIWVKSEGHTIVLYYTGIHHAGENLEEILRRRDMEKPAIIQMCDASSMNIPTSFKTILCNCLGHGFRKFRDLLEFFPEPCLKVMQSIAAVFAVEEKTVGMSALERWRYHRQHSKSVMLELHRWLKAQLTSRQVEPNSSLGKAMRYWLTHWKALRRFLIVPGAPIDNNIVERALKIPIRVRKASMFYKTEHGAAISNIVTSLIQTTALAGENPYDYLIALQEHKSLVFKNPDAWLPWCYRKTLESLNGRLAA